jgi:fumarylacetoacetase
VIVLNETHDPGHRSWLASANDPDGDFPIQNLPFGIFREARSSAGYRGGVAIGDHILDLARAADSAAFDGAALGALRAASEASLNALMLQGGDAWSALRLALSRNLREGSAAEAALRGCLLPQSAAEFDLPARIGDYTDFYASIHHATAVGRLFRPDNPLFPNYRWLPVGYHGRASSIGVSEQAVRRPQGQVLRAGAHEPALLPSARLDFELEVGIFIGIDNPLGEPVPIDRAERHIFGICLLNDWSARDVQAWEYQPLGPFLAKSFATTISPWIVTVEALAPYRTAVPRTGDEPPSLGYLSSAHMRSAGAVDMHLAVYLESARMRESGLAPACLARSNFRHAYWGMGQLVTHHTVNGCNLRAGDLLGSGTLSGPLPTEAGSLLELTQGGTIDLQLPSGETRRFLSDGDRVILRAYCERSGFARIGFGTASGSVLPARAS